MLLAKEMVGMTWYPHRSKAVLLCGLGDTFARTRSNAANQVCPAFSPLGSHG